jgi:hypothetical protein
MINPKHKKAFSMVTAVFVIFVMASVTMLIMNVTGKTLKATTHQYQKEQAQILARSYTELAILYAMHYDRTATPDCLETITDHFGQATPNGYDIRINIKYIGNNNLLANCNSVVNPLAIAPSGTWVDNGTTRFNSTISLVIDTFVSYKDFDDPSDRNITFHRRTLQKL